MIEPRLYIGNIHFKIDEVASYSEPTRVLLCTPDYFDIVDEKNVHMQGHIGSSNMTAVRQQWNELKAVYERLRECGLLNEVAEVKGTPGCEDMVFCANQTFPYTLHNGDPVVVMSRMRHASRQREVVYFEDFFASKGFKPIHLSRNTTFEGMGDLIHHPGKRLLYGGYGHRTNKTAYHELAEKLEVPIIGLELISPKFYHLDTCFVPLSTTSVMLCKNAFSDEGLANIKQFFETVHSIPADEAEKCFSLNAHAFEGTNGGKVAILQTGSSVTKEILIREGYEVIEVETGEFMKSGGSVFCMKMMY